MIVSKICENCNQEHDGIYASGRFCTKECSKSFSTKYRRKEINDKVSKTLKEKMNKGFNCSCANCNQPLKRIPSRVTENNFCSNSCSTTWRNKNMGLGSKGGKASVEKQKIKKRSLNEIYFANLCREEFEIMENPTIFNGWDADIVLVKYKVAILWNGKWHYEKITSSHSVNQVQTRDKIKVNEIKNCGYIPYIVKDMGKHNKNFVEKEFEKFKLYLSCGFK